MRLKVQVAMWLNEKVDEQDQNAIETLTTYLLAEIDADALLRAVQCMRHEGIDILKERS